MNEPPPAPEGGTPVRTSPVSWQATYYKITAAFLLLNDGDQRLLDQFGLSLSQYTVLRLLDPVEGMRPIDLTGPLLLEKSSVSRLVERLVQDQLIQRVAAPDDRRSHRLVLTERGLALREQARAAHEQSLAERLSVLAPDEHARLQALLDKLSTHLRRRLDGTGAP